MNDRPTTGNDDTPEESELRALLEPYAAALSSEAVWADPPANLEMLIRDEIKARKVPTSERRAVVRVGRRRPWVTPLVGAAAAAAAFMAGFVIADEDDNGVAAIAEVDLTGTGLAPEASASGDVVDRGAGYAIRLDMTGLPPADEGEFYEGWLRARGGAMVSIGSFHMRSGDGGIVLWSGVAIAEYDTLVVTEESERSGPAASGRVMLQGEIRPR